jgi:hypothetical protein
MAKKVVYDRVASWPSPELASNSTLLQFMGPFIDDLWTQKPKI